MSGRQDIERQPTGPTPLNHQDDFSRPALRHESLNSHFSDSLKSTFLSGHRHWGVHPEEERATWAQPRKRGGGRGGGGGGGRVEEQAEEQEANARRGGGSYPVFFCLTGTLRTRNWASENARHVC